MYSIGGNAVQEKKEKYPFISLNVTGLIICLIFTSFECEWHIYTPALIRALTMQVSEV